MKKTSIAITLLTMFSAGCFAASANTQAQITLNANQPNGNLPYSSKSSSNNMSTTNDALWISLYKTIVKGASDLDYSLAENGQDIQSCSLHRIKSFHEPVDQFTNSVNPNLPSILSQPTQNLNVDSMYLLSKGTTDNTLTQAYIPSVFAAELLLKKPANPDADLLPSSVAEVVYSQDIHNPNSNFRGNWNSIEIPYEAAKIAKKMYAVQGRTPALDAANLREATIKDLTTFAYIFATHPEFNVNVDDFLKSAMVAYSRNKFMCVFEMQNIMVTVF